MAKLGDQGISYSSLKALASLKPGLWLNVLFNILPGWCELTPSKWGGGGRGEF